MLLIIMGFVMHIYSWSTVFYYSHLPTVYRTGHQQVINSNNIIVEYNLTQVLVTRSVLRKKSKRFVPYSSVSIGVNFFLPQLLEAGSYLRSLFGGGRGLSGHPKDWMQRLNHPNNHKHHNAESQQKSECVDEGGNRSSECVQLDLLIIFYCFSS